MATVLLTDVELRCGKHQVNEAPKLLRREGRISAAGVIHQKLTHLGRDVVVQNQRQEVVESLFSRTQAGWHSRVVRAAVALVGGATRHRVEEVDAREHGRSI